MGCLNAKVWALHAGAAPVAISFIYGPHLYFTGLPWWVGAMWVRQSLILFEQHVPNDVIGRRDLVGWERGLRWVWR